MRGRKYRNNEDGDGPSGGGPNAKKRKPKVTCVDCEFGLACRRDHHWHWAPKNKGKGDHSNAKARILKNKIRPAKPCLLGAECADLNCHCHPVNNPREKDDSPKLPDLKGMSAADAIDASEDMPSKEEVEAEPYPIPPTHPAGSSIPHSASCKCCSPPEEEKSKPNAREGGFKKKMKKEKKPRVKKPVDDDGGPEVSPPEDEIDVDAELDFIHGQVNGPILADVQPPLDQPEIDVPIGDAPIQPDGADDSQESFENFSSAEIEEYTRTKQVTLFFTSNDGVRERKWRTASEFMADVRFAMLTYVSSVNESYITEEKQQVISTQAVTRRRTKSLRWPQFGYRSRRTVNAAGVTRTHFTPTFRRTEAKCVMKREEDVNLNLFKDTYTHSTLALTFPYLTDLLRADQRMKSKVVVDAGGKIRSTFPSRVMDMLAREHTDLLDLYLATPDGEWILENTVAAHVNHCVLMGLFRNRYSTNDAPLVDKPMLNGVKVPSSLSRRSANPTV